MSNHDYLPSGTAYSELIKSHVKFMLEKKSAFL